MQKNSSLHLLTKTRIKSGLNCKKRLWFDVFDRLPVQSHVIAIGNRFGNFIKEYYGNGVDLTEKHGEEAYELTANALNDSSVSVIYEAAFRFNRTLVRTDVLMRTSQGWRLVEVKASTSVNEDHLIDAAIQVYVATGDGLEIGSVCISHINSNFIYKGGGSYEGLVNEVNVDEAVRLLTNDVASWILDLVPLVQDQHAPPPIEMGDQCFVGSRACVYTARCETLIDAPEGLVPIRIIPRIGKTLEKEWSLKGITDLRDLPAYALKNDQQRLIQLCHKKNEEWISPDLVAFIQSLGWPRFFVDFELAQQGIPLIPLTKPFEPLPFQFSIHKWASPDETLRLEDSVSFLEFQGDKLCRNFLLRLLSEVGDDGPIIAHNSATEMSALKRLVNREDCRDLEPAVTTLGSRVIDSLKLIRDGYYHPAMRGSYSLKDVIKGLPQAERYSQDGESVGDGGGAMLKWLEYNDPSQDGDFKNRIILELKRYCAMDTLNLYHLFRHIGYR